MLKVRAGVTKFYALLGITCAEDSISEWEKGQDAAGNLGEMNYKLCDICQLSYRSQNNSFKSSVSF